MAKNSIDFRAVILAGGSGERFWPLSTAEKPKQFLNIFGGHSLIRQSVERLGSLVTPERVLVITSERLVARTQAELPHVPSMNIIGEPMRRDTGAAVALGVGVSAASGDDPVIGFFPSDQLVAQPAKFRAAVRKAVHLARSKETIVTLGIAPTFPATGFGYIDPKKGVFVEKPDRTTARRYIARGYLWNAGMFFARASVFRLAFATFAPDLSCLTESFVKESVKALYASLPRISFDYAVMEKFPCVSVVPGDFGWDDVGSYGAFEKHFKSDQNRNVKLGDVHAVECEGNVCVARGAKITLLGVKDLVVVTSGSDVLVVPKARAGELKKLFAS